MKCSTNQNEYHDLQLHRHTHPQKNNITLRETSDGLFGALVIEIDELDETIEDITYDSYLLIFQELQTHPHRNVIRFWNQVPNITAPLSSAENIYHRFNAGRHRAFKSFYGDEFEHMNIPAASAVGTCAMKLTIEFLAVAHPLAYIENKDQVPSSQYSKRFGKIPPLFSRGVVYKNNDQKLLISSGTASVVGENSIHPDNLHEQIIQTIQNLRILGSPFNLQRYDIPYEFTLDDAITARVYYKHEIDRQVLEQTIPKFFPADCKITYQHAAICREELLVEMEAIFETQRRVVTQP